MNCGCVEAYLRIAYNAVGWSSKNGRVVADVKQSNGSFDSIVSATQRP